MCFWYGHTARELNYVFEVPLLNVGRETEYAERGRIFFLWPTALPGLGLLTVDTRTHARTSSHTHARAGRTALK